MVDLVEELARDRASGGMAGVDPTVAAELLEVGFEVDQEIGRSASGVVYRVSEVALGRPVAVKVLTAPTADNRDRFTREQQVMARLVGHPNIVPVLRFGNTGSGLPYVVTPLCQRGCLDGLIRRRGALPLAEVVRVAAEIAAALEAAQQLGIVHGNVKPANVLVTDFGGYALTDFGISLGFGWASGVPLSGSGLFAPEVSLGQTPRAAADVYGLGVTLLCALTGHAGQELGRGEHPLAQLLEWPSSSVAYLCELGVPREFAEIVAQAVARYPGDRPLAAELRAVAEQMRSELRAAGDGEALSVARVRRNSGNLPVPAGLVGREAQLAELRDRVVASRLVTLLGPGGVGKTTLALNAAHAELASFPDGVWWVELTDVREGALVAEVVAAKLGLSPGLGVSPTDALVAALSERNALLVLDNCEHVIGDAAELLDTLLRRCPRLHTVATSREVLRVDGESVLALEPMSYPALGGELDAAGATDYDAVAFFVDRARSVQPGFALTEGNVELVATICARSDGLPLAIELAAARLRAMPLDKIAERLSDRLAFLTGGRRAAPTRQQALNYCIEWSYDRCTASEQRLWQRLSVFAGGFDIEAAQQVCAGAGLERDAVVDELCSLIDKSIVMQSEHDGVRRYRLLEAIRDYGRARIESVAEQQQLSRTHLQWCRSLLAQAWTEWFSDRQVHWLRRVEQEMPNVREALQFALQDAPDIALEMAAGLRRISIAQVGLLGEGRHWLDLALAAAKPEPSVERIEAMASAALLAAWQEDVSSAKPLIAQARSLMEEASTPYLEGLADLAEGLEALQQRDTQRAKTCLLRAVDSPDVETQGCAMALLNFAASVSGDEDEALTWLAEALALAEAHNETVLRTRVLAGAALVCRQKGEFARAAHFNRQGLRLCLLIGDSWLGAMYLEGAGWFAQADSQWRRAATLLAAASALTLNAGLGVPPYVNWQQIHDNCESRIRNELTVRELHAATAEGYGMNLAQAVAYALETTA
ncbi:protein kinase domain-containing protein [Mycobacterium bourgelatii]|uniref:Protein kinase domain-containing protein n=1 Tax=Mycobacterium bourgelatii TaxID=1273442 RepID=A0A7I9YUD5_MYCBU|nr:protein kinase [Mycobacterium bourgelatii]MCV6974880.1 protein kinase [Mycobacterium bourgelatii]GFG92304.1 hypothetical protein MBOU_43460 [Mycobacterium bourgelatii]